MFEKKDPDPKKIEGGFMAIKHTVERSFLVTRDCKINTATHRRARAFVRARAHDRVHAVQYAHYAQHSAHARPPQAGR